MPWSFLNSPAIQSTTALSKLSPPRWLSPAVALTSNTPSPISSTDTSKVPPPRSKTRIVWSVSLSSPYASEAAVGSLMMRLTSKPAILPASLVALRWVAVEAGDLAGVLRRLALVVVEVRGDGDHRAVDGVAEVGLGVGLQLAEDHRADLGRAELLAARVHASVPVGACDDLVGDDRLLLTHLGLLAAHEALDGEDGVLRVGDSLALRDRAEHPPARGGE